MIDQKTNYTLILVNNILANNKEDYIRIAKFISQKQAYYFFKTFI